ncbi:MAG TPA: alpha/beta hydrolase [Afipia sp.]|uniref:alpha/beta hydrolase n=1 Tax=unclassified Afipia TaxID=2642050 RepID=UPI000464ED67|nr:MULTISPECIES: alpha/beta hydrolase [unclassified Afipia]MAH72040.1 alpha/beta hydrolase [Afipia sp.]OUX58659.1 MAG: alpha/beta hydrolase [Afipia sp. TMED4]HAO42967.1 alpha/beta hydrolase [Afipia sp.]HAP49041.1 alpha/beta hydrolase [Afipia sp.]HAQ93505.1 alpha/beta hydrolase [Afipia sp.]
MSAPVDAPDWRKLTQEQLDLGFNNTLHVPDTPSIVAEWDRLSAEMRARHPQSLDLRYGPRERNRIDFLKAGDDGPTLVFIHGGYWQTRAKENFTFCAAGPMAHGINVALIGYTLAPDASLGQIVDEVRTGIDYLVTELPALGGDPDRMIVSGWSAGGHLSSMSLGHPHIKSGLLISGIYDLEPISHSYLNAKLNLDDATIQRNSPMRNPGGVNKPLVIVAGSGELPLLRKQSADYAAHRAAHGLPVIYEEIPKANHFTMMDELASPTGRLTTLVRQLFAR